MGSSPVQPTQSPCPLNGLASDGPQMKIAVDQDSGFEDSEKTDLNLPNQEIPQPIIDPNQLYQLQLQQYHAWMYYQHNEPNYAISQQVYN